MVKTFGRYFRFYTAETFTRFIELYGDLFIPYSDTYIKSDRRNAFYDDLEYKRLKKGYILDPFYDDDFLLVRVNLSQENFKEILKSGCFIKQQLSPKKSSYRQTMYILKEST